MPTRSIPPGPATTRPTTPTPPLARCGPGCRALLLACLAFALPPLLAMGEPPPDELAAARERLIREVETEIRLTSHYHGSEDLDPAVVAALRAVPRERFVPQTLRSQAYGNHPLPIGLGQTISQPYIVAIMSHLIAIKPGAKVYELGTGSGYQAAVLAEMGADVYTVEIVPELAERAAATLAELGYTKVRVRAGDGYLGWPEAAPFDAIIVTAAGPEVPPSLVAQLRAGGRLVMPLGETDDSQQLVVVTKDADGTLHRRSVLPVRFVPITGGARP
jgi:protein-L-isoaspartate(D-aspartate) O-methyltransferase